MEKREGEVIRRKIVKGKNVGRNFMGEEIDSQSKTYCHSLSTRDKKRQKG